MTSLTSLDEYAKLVLLFSVVSCLFIFQEHYRFLFPVDLYNHYPVFVHPLVEYYHRSGNVQRLTEDAIHSPAVSLLPKSGNLFCFVVTSNKHHHDRVPAISATWLPRCDNGRFYTRSPLFDPTIPYSSILYSFDDAYYDSYRKSMFSLFYTYHYFSHFDWYLKADDDVYFFIDHLKEYLKQFDPKQAYYLGYRMKPFLERGYNGGSGYVLSNYAAYIFNQHLNVGDSCRDEWKEDRGIGRCLANVGVFPEDTRDEKGLNRFMEFYPRDIVNVDPRLHYYPLKNGSLLSENFISIRLPPSEMIKLDLILYAKTGEHNFTSRYLEFF